MKLLIEREESMNWNTILKTINEFKIDNHIVWYRGQGNDSYQLMSSLYRQKFSNIEDVLANERARYNLFKNNGHLYHNLDDWNLLYIMQHHGVKTRLLDWTESFATALFFASSNWENDNPITIWMLNPLKLNYKTLGSFHFYTAYNQIYRDKIKKDSSNSFPSNSLALHPL